jgi:hypothetical protein
MAAEAVERRKFPQAIAGRIINGVALGNALEVDYDVGHKFQGNPRAAEVSIGRRPRAAGDS